ncbi:hypothetical protein QPM17_21690 [Marinobacter sp. TBZ242]|uniref:Uncharacterized protein n=1 Tax=Marinobacter azerbaijanicus TaxID=3050455 RepID=A0ABT7IHV6_9GAMM|nr:hypothetical protein [Marinobacter sp. TBZ242]MDL0433762.1 hypothetical protein [Marinobacter sp. TBZ242]
MPNWFRFLMSQAAGHPELATDPQLLISSSGHRERNDNIYVRENCLREIVGVRAISEM